MFRSILKLHKSLHTSKYLLETSLYCPKCFVQKTCASERQVSSQTVVEFENPKQETEISSETNTKLKGNEQETDISPETNNELARKDEKSRTVLKRLSKSSLNEINKFIESKDELKDFKTTIMAALTEEKKFCASLYLVDYNIADQISQLIVPYLQKSSSLIVETNPGIGILSRSLLKAGITNIELYESNEQFYDYLKNQTYLSGCKIFRKDLIRLWRLAFYDRQDFGSRIADIFSGTEARKWEDDPVIQMILTVQNKKFITDIIHDIVFLSGIVQYGRPEFYICMDPMTYASFTCTGEDGYVMYRTSSVLFQVLFEYEVLGKVPRKHFIPWDKIVVNQKSKFVQEVYKTEGDMMYICRITGKKDLYKIMGSNLPAFYYFIKQVIRARGSRILPILERWLPLCGPNIISLGLDPYTAVGELNPQELLKVFLKFVNSHEDYHDSSFYNSLESFLLKKCSAETADTDDHD